MSEPYGRTLPAPFAHYDPDTSSWRTSQPSLLPESLPEHAPTWPRSGTWDLGAAYEQPTWEPPTDEHASSSLLPTPAVNDMGEGKTVEAWDAWTAKQKAKHGNGNGHGPSLAIEAQRLLPTAMDSNELWDN